MRLFKLLKLESELRDELMENTRLLFKYMLSPKNNHKRYLVDTSSNSHIDFMHQYPSKGTQVEIIHMKNGNHKIRMYDSGDDKWRVQIVANDKFPNRFRFVFRGCSDELTDHMPETYPPMDDFYYMIFRCLSDYCRNHVRYRHQQKVMTYVKEMAYTIKHLDSIYGIDIDLQLIGDNKNEYSN